MDERLPNLLLKTLGQRIKKLRKDQGYSQEAFADKCGVHRTFMGTIERGESNLSFKNILKVTTTLGISLSTLFRELEDKAETSPPETVEVRPKLRTRPKKSSTD